ncbi:hypothetical protein [Ochrobactrum sp. EDr1-4]|uniref:hypothetical protein n=1 Tax=Ochrobactrum sp. EDr1-4 TaxID=3368622 RepID=UPI003BA24609
MTIPEKALRAAQEATEGGFGITDDYMRRALTAALPFLQWLPSSRAQALEEAAQICDAENARRTKQYEEWPKDDFAQRERFRVGAQMATQIATSIRALSSQPVASPIRYRLIEDGEAIEENDEFIEDDAVNWTSVTVNRWVIGMKYNRSLKAVRRPLPASPGASATRQTGGSDADA